MLIFSLSASETFLRKDEKSACETMLIVAGGRGQGNFGDALYDSTRRRLSRKSKR
jgi:hypothetical protein